LHSPTSPHPLPTHLKLPPGGPPPPATNLCSLHTPVTLLPPNPTPAKTEVGVLKIADFGLSKSLKMPKPKRKDVSHTTHGRSSMDAVDSRAGSITA